MTDPKQPPKPPAGSMLLWRKAAGDGGDGFLRVGGYDTWGPPKPELQNGLLFRRIADGSAGLLFGYTVNPGNAQAPTAEVSIDAVFAADMPARIGFASVQQLGIAASFGNDMPAALGLDYDINVPRPLLNRASDAAQHARPMGGWGTRSSWQSADHLDATTRSRSQTAQPQAAAARARWQGTVPLPAMTRTAMQAGQPLGMAARGGFDSTQPLRSATRARLQVGQPLGLGLHSLYQQMISLRTITQSHAQAAAPVLAVLLAGFADGLGQHTVRRQHLQKARPLPVLWLGHPPPPEEDKPGYCPALLGQLVFERRATGTGELVFIYRPCGDAPPPLPDAAVVVPVKKVYIVQNSITLTRLDTGAELQAHSFGMSLDYQSWTWSWQASLHHTAAAHLGRDTQGDPADLLATINGVPFRLRLERVARDRRHLPQERYSVSGKGRAAILDAPWAPVMQFGNPLADYTAQQLAVNALTINGVPIGWGVDWQLDDWLVPAGAWALQGSYIAAINDIAQAVGGYVQPHNTDAVLRILHKYPTAPWEWGAVTPEFEIPSALAEVESTEFIDKPIYNRIYVGGQGAGVFGPLTRAATPGDKIAPQATHPLITASAAWRQRGRAELSDVGKQERIRISLPVLQETGVITPGQFVRYRTGPQHTQTGIVRGTAIDWQRPRLRQTLEIEAHEPV